MVTAHFGQKVIGFDSDQVYVVEKDNIKKGVC